MRHERGFFLERNFQREIEERGNGKRKREKRKSKFSNCCHNEQQSEVRKI